MLLSMEMETRIPSAIHTHGAVFDALVEKLEAIVNANCALEEYHQQRQSEV